MMMMLAMGWEVDFTEWLEEQASTMNSLENKEEEITAMELGGAEIITWGVNDTPDWEFSLPSILL